MAIQSAISSPFGGIIGSPSRRPQLRDIIRFPFATGGTETVIEQDGKFYRVHTYTDVGTDDFEVLRGGEVEYLVVAGGGGGGAGGSSASGGGGAGALILSSDKLTAQIYSVVVGAGGPAGKRNSPIEFGVRGEESSFLDAVALGGGGGRYAGSTNDEVDGACGGGGSSAGNSTIGGAGSVGFDGGSGVGSVSTGASAGGGGGMSSRGDDGVSAVQGGNGGQGFSVDISGSIVGYSGGGGGAGRISSQAGLGAAGGGNGGFESAGHNAVLNTGSGGGGGTGDNDGGAGGSGIVIIRYRITQAEYEAA